MEVMRLDALYNEEALQFSESSIVERLQNVFLLLMLLTLVFTKGFKAIKNILLFVLGIFFIREQDAFLDHLLGEHSWKYISLLYAAGIGFFIYKERKSILSEIDHMMTTASSGILFLGFTTLLIFSRMFGRKKFWKIVEGTENYTRNVKNAAEECTELFGYFILLIGVIEFYIYVNSTLKRQK